MCSREAWVFAKCSRIMLRLGESLEISKRMHWRLQSAWAPATSMQTLKTGSQHDLEVREPLTFFTVPDFVEPRLIFCAGECKID